MSDDHFHVHGPHDHHVEHAAQGASEHGHGDPQASQIAVITAVLATLGALFSYMGGLTQANAGLDKNNAAIKKTEASNQWNYYQAKSSKQNLAELAIVLLPPERQQQYEKEVARYKTEKEEIKKQAEHLEAESKEWDEQSDHQMHLHHRWAQATTALQVAIALAAISLLTRRKWLQYGVYAVATVGLAVAGIAALQL